VETLNMTNSLKEHLSKVKPIRTIEIDNVEAPEKALTLTIEDKPKTTTRKATIEEMPDEEAPDPGSWLPTDL
jgi:hypothetical protein